MGPPWAVDSTWLSFQPAPGTEDIAKTTTPDFTYYGDAVATPSVTTTTTTTPTFFLRTSPRTFARKIVSSMTTYAEALQGGAPFISAPSTGSPVAATLDDCHDDDDDLRQACDIACRLTIILWSGAGGGDAHLHHLR